MKKVEKHLHIYTLLLNQFKFNILLIYSIEQLKVVDVSTCLEQHSPQQHMHCYGETLFISDTEAQVLIPEHQLELLRSEVNKTLGENAGHASWA